MADKITYDLYLIHNKIDEGWVTDLATRIEKEQYQGRNLKVFFSKWDIETGQNFVLTLNNALTNSRFAAIILSPEAVISDWVQREWTSALLKDISGNAGRIIPVLRRNCNIPLFLRVLAWVDFRNQLDYDRAYNELIRRIKGENKPRGVINPELESATSPFSILASALIEPISPDIVQEQLESNCYPVIGLPMSWFRAQTHFNSVSEILQNIEKRNSRLPAFIIKEHDIICLNDLHDAQNPLSQLIDPGLIREEAIQDIFTDSLRKPWLIELLNKCLMISLFKKGIAFDNDHFRYYFIAPRESNERKERWKSPKKWSQRTVARAVIQDDILLRWEHQAAYMQFINFENRFVLLIEPTWTFTKDGKRSLEFKRITRLAIRKMYRGNNAVVLNDTRFWIAYISENRNELRLPTSGQPIRISTTPYIAELAVGLEWDQIVPDVVSNPPSDWDNLEYKDNETSKGEEE
ncbi:MAG: toll/interleukin-1 receptor domain-containing protein [Euryarchaeota archaeon]|nr:toll/interleukin-1 receptor domain-containing protein [Euryarchaeota archaeon]